MGKLVRYLKAVEPKALGVLGGISFYNASSTRLSSAEQAKFLSFKKCLFPEKHMRTFLQKIGFGRHITTFEKS